MKKTALLLIIISLLSLFLVSCDNNEKKTEEAQTNIEEKEVEENNLYDPDLLGTWILQEEAENGEEKPVQGMHFFENGDCYNYYYNTGHYDDYYDYETDKRVYLFEYYVSKDTMTDWYTDKSASLMIQDGNIFKYNMKDNVLTVVNTDGESEIFIKSDENFVDIITKNDKWIKEIEDNAYAEYKKANPYSDY